MPCIIIGYTEVHNEKLEPRIFALNAESQFDCVNRYQFPFMNFEMIYSTMCKTGIYSYVYIIAIHMH